jgi:hypothetical protein
MDPAGASPTCGHTYTSVPPGGVDTLRATVTWEVTWVGGGTSGSVPPLTTAAALNLRVQEAGALNAKGVG